MKKIKYFYLLLICICFGIIGYSKVNVFANDNAVISYKVGQYSFQTDTQGDVYAIINGKKYQWDDDAEIMRPGFMTALQSSENKNVVYKFEDNKIVAMYALPEVLDIKVTVEHNESDGLTYQNGKFNKKNFTIYVKVSNKLKSKFSELEDMLTWRERNLLAIKLKEINIKTNDLANFGSTGWWFWKDYKTELQYGKNSSISVGETEWCDIKTELKDKANLGEKQKYQIKFDIDVFHESGSYIHKETGIDIANLDYQEKIAKKNKKSSQTGKQLSEATKKLDGVKSAIQFRGDYFSSSQTKQINEFVNAWISELILAKHVDKSSLSDKVTDKIANEWLKRLGMDSSVFISPGEIKATTFLETETKDKNKVYIQFDIDLLNFNFGNKKLPTMATGTGSATIYDKNGKELDSSVLLPAYADICTFCEQLQDVAKDTIFNGAKQYLGIFGVSVDATAEALSSQMMVKLLNNKYTKNIFKIVDARDMKSALKFVTVKAEKYTTKKIYKLAVTSVQKRTEISINCPVDVKVYDDAGNVCGIIKNNKIDTNYSGLYMSVVGDKKTVYLAGDDYNFELTGTDSGTMDYIVKEFDENGNVLREMSYEEIPLTEGRKYYSYVPETEDFSHTIYDLTDKSGNSILPKTGLDEEKEEDSIKIVDSGTCGDNAKWTLDKEGVLRISGTGKMYDFENYYKPLTPTPWKDKADQIKYVLIEDGITSIGNDAFYQCYRMQHVYIPNTVTSIGSYAFAFCRHLEEIVIPESVKSIDEYSFHSVLRTLRLQKIIMRGDAPTTKDNSFSGVYAKLLIPDNASGYETKSWSQMIMYSNNKIHGKCGDNLTWELTSDGKLLINGSGDMYNYYFYGIDCNADKYDQAPWYTISDQIKEININIKNGTIGNEAFVDCSNLKKVTINSGVRALKHKIFAKCKNLQSVIIPASVTSIEIEKIDRDYRESTFKDCNSEVVIYCIRGSYAEKYAKENKMKYQYINTNDTHEHKWDKGKITKEPTCFAKGTKTYTCSVCGSKKTVQIAKLTPAIKPNVNSISLNKSEVTTKLKVSGLVKGDYVKSWTSSNKKIVTITGKSNGTCTIKAGTKTGTAKITITLASGLKKTVTVTVSKKTVDCKSIGKVPKKLTLKKKKTYKLKPVIKPSNCTAKAKYTTSNKKIVKVDSKGKITAVKKGKAKITVTVGKKKVVCVVTVK